MGLVRLFLALAVVLSHSWELPGFGFIGGNYAVELFFIISGFYMTLVLNTKYIDSGGGVLKFWFNRFLRLYPTYWMVLVFTVIGYLFLFGKVSSVIPGWCRIDQVSSLSLLSGFLLILSNLAIVGQDILMFTAMDSGGNLYFTPNFHMEARPSYEYLVVPQAWSVGVEIAFYIIAPFILRRSVRWLIWIMASSFLIRAFLIAVGLTNDPWSHRFFPSELCVFLLGAVACKLTVVEKRFALPTWIALVSLSVYLGLIAWFSVLADFGAHFIGKYAGHLLEYVMMALLAMMIGPIFQATKNSAVDRFIGDLSYPIYIIHIGFLAAWSALSQLYPSWTWLGSGKSWHIALLMLVSAIVVLVVERPLDRVRQRLAAKSSARLSSKSNTVELSSDAVATVIG